MNDGIWYLAGPMTGIPQFNFPAFFAAADALRARGFEIISPAELDDDNDKDAAMKSTDGSLENYESENKKTWGDFLARDVKLIADQCSGIIFLAGWAKSRGARLEAFVGILCKHQFARYVGDGKIEKMSAQAVLTEIARSTYAELKNG